MSTHQLPDPKPIIGPIFIGVILNWALFGSLVVQLYAYYINYRHRDIFGVRATVYGLCLLEVVQSFIVTDLAWFHLVELAGNPEGFSPTLQVKWSVIGLTAGDGIVATVVQVFFAWRIYILNRSSWAAKIGTAFIILLSFLQCGASIAVGAVWDIKYHRLPLELYNPEIKTLTILWLVPAFVTDLLIAAGMVVTLRRARKHSAIQKTNLLINRLIIHIIENSVLTTVLALVALVVYLPSRPGLNYELAPAFVFGKLYSNVLLANLNGRQRREERAPIDTGLEDRIMPHDINIPMEHSSGRYTRSKTSPFNGLQITTEITTDAYLEQPSKVQLA